MDSKGVEVMCKLKKHSTIRIHEQEQSAHCREKDTGGSCGGTGDVGVKTSDSQPHMYNDTHCTPRQFSTIINL